MSQITITLSTMPDPPDPALDNNTTFPPKAVAFTEAMVVLQGELNTMIGQINGVVQDLNSGVGVSFRYTFSNLTTAADPGGGFLRLNNATQNAATAAYVDNSAVGNGDIGAYLDTWDDSTSDNKGTLRLQHVTDPTKWAFYYVTLVVNSTGYRTLSLQPLVASSASPFANNDGLIASFTRTGDKWAGGAVVNRAYTPPAPDVTFSATPTIDAALSNVFEFNATMNTNVTNLTINNPVAGQPIQIAFTQDAVGGRTVALPSNIKAASSIELGANRTSLLNLVYSGKRSRWEGGWTTVPA